VDAKSRTIRNVIEFWRQYSRPARQFEAELLFSLSPSRDGEGDLQTGKGCLQRLRPADGRRNHRAQPSLRKLICHSSARALLRSRRDYGCTVQNPGG
jgi:hypothetical protein